MNRHAVILAGGVGSRLWPLSRTSAPKQFQRFVGDLSLLQETYNRVRPLFPPENIWVITTEVYAHIALEQLPEIPANRIILEPESRNTAAAVGLATLVVQKEDPKAALICLPADHYIGKVEIFRAALEQIFYFLEHSPKTVVTVGINPTEPNTGLGYIQIGNQISKDRHFPIFAAARFIEKPSLKDATSYFESWDYLWNGGYYAFTVKAMERYLKNYAPEIYSGLNDYLKNADKKTYTKIPTLSIDVSIAEKLPELAVMPADLDWSDLGNWSTLQDIINKSGGHVDKSVKIDTNNTLVIGGTRLIAAVGLKDIIIVDTEDVVLVCHRESVQSVKELVERLRLEHKEIL